MSYWSLFSEEAEEAYEHFQYDTYETTLELNKEWDTSHYTHLENNLLNRFVDMSISYDRHFCLQCHKYVFINDMFNERFYISSTSDENVFEYISYPNIIHLSSFEHRYNTKLYYKKCKDIIFLNNISKTSFLPKTILELILIQYME